MKKLYLFLFVFVILIAPIFIIVTSGILLYLIILSQLISMIIMVFMKKTSKSIYKYRGNFLRTIIFNTFANDKEKLLIENTEWINYIDNIKKIKIDEILDNK